MSGMWTDPANDPRNQLPPGVGEKGVLTEYLDRYRMTLELKCEGLTPEQLATRSVPPSTMSLLGLLRHLASVERHWFRHALDGDQDVARLYPETSFEGAVPDDEVVADAWEQWRVEVAFGKEWLAACPDLGATFDYREQQVEVRDIIVHLVEEYARHLRHADLLRECIDGRTGE